MRDVSGRTTVVVGASRAWGVGSPARSPRLVLQLESVDHMPLLLETSRPGIFSVGDVRSRSVKRVATAIGEGSMAVRLVFDRLQATGIALVEPVRTNAV